MNGKENCCRKLIQQARAAGLNGYPGEGGSQALCRSSSESLNRC